MLSSQINWLGVIFGAFIWPRDLVTNKIGAEVFGKFSNAIQEENREDKMVRENN